MSLLSVISLPLRLRARLSLKIPLWLTSLRSQFLLFIVVFCSLQFAGVLLLNTHPLPSGQREGARVPAC